MLQRRFFSHWIWDEKRSFSKAEAFLDLLQLAAFAPTKRMISGSLIELDEGEIVASVRYLAVRWSWGKDKVATFLKTLETDAIVTRKTRHGETIVTLCNYKDYNSRSDTKSDTNKDRRQTETRQTPDKVQEGKEFKKLKKGIGTLEELKAYAVEIGLQESDGSFMFAHWESNGWKNGQSQSRDWKAGIRKWKEAGWLPSQKAAAQQKPDHREAKAQQEFSNFKHTIPILSK